MTHLW